MSVKPGKKFGFQSAAENLQLALTKQQQQQ